MINSVILSGRLTKDAEVHTFTNSSKATFAIAVNKKVKNGDKWETKVNYFDIEIWNSSYLHDFLKKGVQAVVSGELDSSEYEKDGRKIKRIYVRADKVQTFLKKEDKPEPSEMDADDIP